MSISLLSNAYLDEALAKTRGKPVPWEVIILFFELSLLFILPVGLSTSGPHHLRGTESH